MARGAKTCCCKPLVTSDICELGSDTIMVCQQAKYSRRSSLSPYLLRRAGTDEPCSWPRAATAYAARTSRTCRPGSTATASADSSQKSDDNKPLEIPLLGFLRWPFLLDTVAGSGEDK